MSRWLGDAVATLAGFIAAVLFVSLMMVCWPLAVLLLLGNRR